MKKQVIDGLEQIFLDIRKAEAAEAESIRRNNMGNPDHVVTEDYVDGALRIECPAQRRHRRAVTAWHEKQAEKAKRRNSKGPSMSM